jgi:cell division protein FtsL
MKKQLLDLAGVLVLAAGVTASGLWIVETEHHSRQLFIHVEELNREQDRLQIDWGRLQIEQSTWATHPRIESLAHDRMHLTAPRDEQLVVVVEPKR